MVSKYRDILEPPAEMQMQRASPVLQRATPTQGNYRKSLPPLTSNKASGAAYSFIGHKPSLVPRIYLAMQESIRWMKSKSRVNL
jgi:hypothetical protein